MHDSIVSDEQESLLSEAPSSYIVEGYTTWVNRCGAWPTTRSIAYDGTLRPNMRQAHERAISAWVAL